MASNRHAFPLISHNAFICIFISLLLPTGPECAVRMQNDRRGSPNDDGGRRLTREYDLRQGALRGLIVKPSRQYDLQSVEMFLGIPYAAPPVGNFRFMPPASAPSWSGVKMATRFAPVCPQTLPAKKKGDPPSLGRQRYMERLEPFLKDESEDCLYLNIYVPYREQKSKKFPVLVLIHGDSFEWSSGNPYDGRILAAYGNVMVITINFRLGILGFIKLSLPDHDYGNNGLLDQLAALQWIKDNIEDLNGDPNSVTLMGHGTGAACVSFLMLSPISNGLFHRAILMSGSALSDWAITKYPTQYTLQVAQSLGCNPTAKNLMICLQNKTLSEIKKVQILAREFETPLGPVVAGLFVPNKPIETMVSFPNLLSKYQMLSGVTEYETYHDFGAIELEHGILETQRDEFIIKYAKLIYESAEDVALKEILKKYSPSRLDPQRWNVETNRDVILNLFSDARTLSPLISFANYHSKANRQSYFYVFGHNSVSTHYAPLNKSVHGEEMPYVLGVPLGGANTHLHSEYTLKEKLLSESVMRLWTNFVKIGTPNTQSVNHYYTLDQRQWNHYNIEWPEYNIEHQSYLRLDIPPFVSSFYRSNETNFWIESLPSKMRKFVSDPIFDFTPTVQTTYKPKPIHKPDPVTKIWSPHIVDSTRFASPTYGNVNAYSPPGRSSNSDQVYRELQHINKPSLRIPKVVTTDKSTVYTTIKTPNSLNNNTSVKTSGATVNIIVLLGIVFLIINIGICTIIYLRKRKLRVSENGIQPSRQTRMEVGEIDVIGHKSLKEDKSTLKSIKNSCNAIKSLSLNKMRGNSEKSKKKQESYKTPKSDNSGGFRERFQLRRHLSTSTLDAHTKVRDWIANEVIHRCSPSILRTSNLELNTNIKPFTRSEELISEIESTDKDIMVKNVQNESLLSGKCIKMKTSEKTTSTSALGSSSSINSRKKSKCSKNKGPSTESLKSKGTESIKSKKVSVAIDATPSARTNSVLQQEPIEFSKSFDDKKHSESENSQPCVTKQNTDIDTNEVFTNQLTVSVEQDVPLKISHKHSISDPVTDVNYDFEFDSKKQFLDILPPVVFRNDINVTSKDENIREQPLTVTEALLTIKRRNFPKVLPDLPQAQKRFSLQPAALQTFRSYIGSIESEAERLKIPPQPPPRTTTLERRLAYRHSKPLSSFSSKIDPIVVESEKNKNYENIDNYSINQGPEEQSTKEKNKTLKLNELGHGSVIQEREYPKVIIASSDTLCPSDSKIIIKPSPAQAKVHNSVPRVRLPDDFHSHSTGSMTSFSSFYSDDEIDEGRCDFANNLEEDKLIQELVGGVNSPTNMEELDSKGPETDYVRKLEIVPVKINLGQNKTSNVKENYICISDLLLPEVSSYEKTAQIKPTYGMNKLQKRSESIHKPPEKAIKVKQKGPVKTSLVMKTEAKQMKTKHSKNKNELEHSNSGSSNDTETSTGTVRKVDVRKLN